jgi:thiol-disulfide isomerase/thioredoxin
MASGSGISIKTILALAVGGALAGLFAGYHFDGGLGRGDGGTITAAQKMAPSRAQFRQMNGRKVSLTDFLGKPVLVNFWATWCGPCIEEIPLLESYAKSRGDSIKVIGVAEDDPAAVTDFLKDQPIAYSVWQGADQEDEDALSIEFGNTRSVLPFTVLINASGQVVRKQSGSFASEADIARFVAASP